MRFFLITDNYSETKPVASLLEEACRQRHIECIKINADTYDQSQFPEIQSTDALYRPAITYNAAQLETELLSYNPITFRQKKRNIFTTYKFSHVVLSHHDIPIPKTISHATNNKELLKNYAQDLGGFPLILKVLGGSHGVGVMKIDSLAGLFSIADFLVASNIRFILRAFISVQTSARFIVLGDKVIDSIEYHAPKNDFRSNEGESPNVVAKKYAPEIEEIAVRAVHSLQLEFGGVDILLDGEGNAYVIEVNFPCYFPRCQELTGVDSAGQMIDFLVEKSKKNI